jgi:uncharacterized protein
MGDSVAARNVATDALDVVVREIVDDVHPELVVLFGSRAWGTPHDYSDYDLMLVLGDDVPIEPTCKAAYVVARRHGLSVDILAQSATEYARHQHDPGLLSYMVARQGRVLFTTGAIPQRSASPRRLREGPPREGVNMWIARAEADLRGAEAILGAAQPAWDGVCFHAHACIEKLLKALIAAQGSFPPRTHELLDLLKHQVPEIRDDASIIVACDVLMALWPRSRYPHLLEPRPEEARQALDAARDLRRRLLPRLDAPKADAG